MTLPILGTSAVSKDKMRQLLSQRNPNPPFEVLDLYYDLESSWGIRADTMICQMFHETDFLKSWWSQPPRRNMAGIGVTGESSDGNPNSDAWAFKPEDNRWYKGYSFADWRAAVQAHYAHMVAYCYPDERNNARQYDPRYTVAKAYISSKGWPPAQVMTDLNGRWAVPGTTYGQSIEQVLDVANSLPGLPGGSSSPTIAVDMSVSARPSSDYPAPNVIDLTSRTPGSAYTPSRAPYDIKVLILHDTVGSDSAPDRNNLGLDNNGYQSRENNAIAWFQRENGISVHYLVGPEALGGKVYRLCPESGVAYHAGGSPGFPSSWVAPDGKKYEGRFNDVGVMNYISIGIERWGGVNETPGPNQTRNMIGLAVDIARRNNLSAQQIVPHSTLEGDRTDGKALLEQIRSAVNSMRATVAAPQQISQAAPPMPAPPPATSAPAASPIQVLPPVDIPAPAMPLPAPPPAQAATPSPIQVLPPVDIPSEPAPAPVEVPTMPVEPTPVEAPVIDFSSNSWAQGVDAVTASPGAGIVANDGTMVRSKPRLDAETIRLLNSGTAVRWNAYTDSGADIGLGSRWYLLDDADGGGWLYSGAVN